MQDVVSAVYKGDYRIEFTFDDGKKGVVDFTKYLERGGVFERLKDKEFFARFEVNQELGTAKKLTRPLQDRRSKLKE